MFRKRWPLYLLLIFLLPAAACFVLRNQVLAHYIGKYSRKFESKGLHLTVGASGFTGLAGIALTDLTLCNTEQDTLAYLRQATGTISLRRLIKAQLPLDGISLLHGAIFAQQERDSLADATDPEVHEEMDADNGERTLVQGVQRFWNRFFDLADFDLRMEDIALYLGTAEKPETVSIEKLSLERTRLEAHAVYARTDSSASWSFTGIVDPHSETLAVQGTTDAAVAGSIPFLFAATGVEGKCKAFECIVKKMPHRGPSFRVQLAGSAYGTSLRHWRIGEADVVVDSVAVLMNVEVSDHGLQTDSVSGFKLNQIPMYTRIRYEEAAAPDSGKTLDIGIRMPTIEAQDFFNSLPHGLFNSLEGIRVSGTLAYHLDFHLNTRETDSLKFDSRLEGGAFRVQAFGAEKFNKINEPFWYTAVENDVPLRTFEVGPSNPAFTPIGQISPLLIGAVLIAEDGTFFYHRGFNEEAFRQSIATNIREKRFARGGSTITMQLVKNVFLSRDKTISRKLEEAIIVWMLEHTGMVSKERMLEVYLNIIEWGPGVYGIGEAAPYYFSKSPASLSLAECVYLSAIIPRPKTFRYTFDEQGKLRTYLKSYFNVVAGRMVRKEIIAPADTVNADYQVTLTGDARNLLIIAPDTLAPDSLNLTLPDLDPEP